MSRVRLALLSSYTDSLDPFVGTGFLFQPDKSSTAHEITRHAMTTRCKVDGMFFMGWSCKCASTSISVVSYLDV